MPFFREGSDPVDVRVKLDGASAFFLKIENGSDGISHDQSNWAEAKVEFTE